MAPVRADEATLKLTFKPLDGAKGEKTVFVARERDQDGNVRAETRVEVSVSKEEGKSVAIRAEEKAPPKKEDEVVPQARRDDVADAIKDAQEATKDAREAMKDARQALRDAHERLKEARRQLVEADAQVKTALGESLRDIGIYVGSERRCDKEPETVTDLLGIDAKIVVAGSATRQEVKVEVGGQKVACTLHEFQVREGAKTRSLSVWLSPSARGAGIVAIKSTSDGVTREVTVEGFVAPSVRIERTGANNK
jgi:hypothetical protein